MTNILFLVGLLNAAVVDAERVEERNITVTLAVPDAAWSLAIEAVYEINAELWVVSTVSRDPSIVGAQTISTVQDSVAVAAPDFRTRVFVLGKDWDWSNSEPYSFIEKREHLEYRLSAGRLLYGGQVALLGTRPE